MGGCCDVANARVRKGFHNCLEDSLFGDDSNLVGIPAKVEDIRGFSGLGVTVYVGGKARHDEIQGFLFVFLRKSQKKLTCVDRLFCHLGLVDFVEKVYFILLCE